MIYDFIQLGKIQNYKLGLYLRTRYPKFISEQVIPDDIHTLSSDIDRTIQSAYATLAGFYSQNPTSNITRADEIIWQPVPVHTIALPVDNVS